MDAELKSCIVENSHAAIGNHKFHFRLLLTKKRTVHLPTDNTVIIRSYLTQIKRKVAYAPLAAPTVDHRRKHIGISLVTRHIIFTLIPDDATDSHADKWVQHTIKE